MKEKNHVVCVILILISISILPLFSSAGREQEPVYDIKGSRLRVDQPYSILPADPSTGLGFNMEVIGNKTCPFDVIQAKKDTYEIPLQLYPANSTKGDIIRISTDLNIYFWRTYTSCLNEYSNFWKVDRYSPSTGKYFITTGGDKGNPGKKTIGNWFKIEKSGDFYKFVYCPSVCKTCKVICKDIGIFVEDGIRRAVLSDVPFEFNIKKFTGYTATP